MSVDPKVAELLAPLTQAEDALASRRVHVDRERIVSHMVETAVAPNQRMGRRARVAAALALAATFAFASWGGLQVYERAAARAPSIQVSALRGRARALRRS